MSYSATSTISRGRLWSGLTSKIPLSRNSFLGIATVSVLVIAVFLTWMLAAGGGESFSTSQSGRSGDEFAVGATPAMAPAPAGAASFFGGDGSLSVTVTNDAARARTFAKAASEESAPQTSGGASLIGIGQRQTISRGSMSVEVTDVANAAARVRAIAEGAGGFVEQLSSIGVDEFKESTLTIRVPQDEFFPVFEKIKALGKVRNENAGSEDVTERFIDLEARLKSSQRKEASLLSLLDRAGQVSEILVIERELARVRTELEQVQGQLNFLERQVDLATITVSLTPPQRDEVRAPSGSLSIGSPNVGGSVDAVKAIVSQVGREIDQVFSSVQNGRQRAIMTVRVFSQDFNLLIAAVEDQGVLVSKEVREGQDGDPGNNGSESEEPNARLDIVFGEQESSTLGRNLAIFAPLGSVGLLMFLGLLSYGAYRMGMRRED
ncbi:MAG: DUF4349 domain-containing protein [Chloroflexi bacterium]|nr:DUF4349 domain-containing protein [Chloroflexota bacterium]